MDALVLTNPDSKALQWGTPVQARAKLNLSLTVLDKRIDGFHEIDTVMVALSLADELTFHRQNEPGISLICSDPGIPSDSSNLVWRAAQTLAEASGLTPALRIELVKRIPAGGGLGGGSSDAAATLIALNRLWQLDYTVEQLHETAARLGSDVPFFLYGGAARCTGRGERVEALNLNVKQELVLVLPPVHVSTAIVYRHYQPDAGRAKQSQQRVNRAIEQQDLGRLLSEPVNDLLVPCEKAFPEIAGIKSQLEALSLAPVGLCGSGAGLFLPAPDRLHAQQWVRRITEDGIAPSLCVTLDSIRQPAGATASAGQMEPHHADH